jgi:hypothetical protein
MITNLQIILSFLTKSEYLFLRKHGMSIYPCLNKMTQSENSSIHFSAKNLILLSGLLFFSACAGLPQYAAHQKTNTEISEFSGHYDAESNIRYTIEHDSENIYLALMTTNFNSQVKILSRGLTVYIDESGKKKKGKYWTYPFIESRSADENFNRGQLLPDFFPGQNEKAQMLYRNFQYKKQSLKLFGFDGLNSSKVFFSPFDKSPVQISTSMDSSGIFTYMALIPKSMLFNGDKNISDVFTVGVKSGGMGNQTAFSGKQAVAGMKQGGRGGGRHAGMGGGGGARTGISSTGNNSKASSPIDFWFEVVLQ